MSEDLPDSGGSGSYGGNYRQPEDYEGGDDSDGWIDNAVDAVRDDIPGPSDVIGWVAVWLIGGILMFRDAVAGIVVTIYETVDQALIDAGSAVLGAFSTIGDVPIALLEQIDAALAEMVLALGPFAIVVYPAIGFGMVVIAASTFSFVRARVAGVIAIW